MKTFIFLRHGESIWNKENRFTGWTDVDLTEKGVEEAIQAAKLIKQKGYIFRRSFTSVLKRAVRTNNIVLEHLDQDWVPIDKSWLLNEKHYGALQGLNKADTANKYGDEQVLIWRRSYDVAAPALSENDPRNPKFDVRYKYISESLLPLTESLKDTFQRTIPYWIEILGLSEDKDTILVTAHGNSLRSIIKYIKDISDEDIISLNIPTGIPYIFEFTDNDEFIHDYFLGNEDEIKSKLENIISQGKSV